ncbi:RNA-binding protein [Mucilaginibacter daejeonensis]|uniref:RNA recognition motif domain-containing protein n=1 Tax=Mucilaginibacter daejeonensis TaxID=398049 RepID=UPI001D17C141|nr:RNA-binding protein [Mucilaginibacter daejeonensis]UEG54884.1 RNA-binding protein [Mucilaginibacter daejeonensis]
MTKLFVSGFPLEITEMELARMLGPYGDISTIKIIRDKQTRKCKGYAFIEMVSPEAAEKAIEALDGVEMQGRPLTVKITEDKPVLSATNYRRSFAAPSMKFNESFKTDPSGRPKRPRRTLQ